MAQTSKRSWQPRAGAYLLAAGTLSACAVTQPTFNEQAAMGGSTTTAGGASAGGGQSSAGSSSVAVTESTGGAAAAGGQSSGGETSAGGDQTSAGNSSVGSTNSVGGASLVGGAPAAGGTAADGGQSSAGNSSVGGANSTGGVPATTGGAISTGGVPATGGAMSTSGVATQGGSQPIAGTAGLGGSDATGGAAATGGVAPSAGGTVSTGGSTGGTTASCTPTTENCTDGIDNDCNGNIDCPIVSGRFPEPGRAAAGDDAWVQLNAPTLAIQAVQCRTGKPSQIAAKLWAQCTSSSPTSLTVYSMGAAAAQLAANDGVTQFDFRFLYTNGLVSDPSSIVYYAHSSLWDTVAGTSTLACPPLAADSAYFSLASTHLTGATSQPTFAASDAKLKNPFIALQFSPSNIGTGTNNFPSNSAPQAINVLSLRHRFVLDSTRQMLLLTRAYKSRRETGQTCRAAIIQVKDKHTNNLPNTPPFKNNHCDAIVLNKAGSGVCIEVVGGTTPTIRGLHGSTIHALLVGLGIPWPDADMTMWQKLFDDRPQRKTLLVFSDKCRAEDAACLTDHTHALSLPDSGDQYFASP